MRLLCVDSIFRGRSLRALGDTSSNATQSYAGDGITRRTFLGAALAGGATILAAGPGAIFGAASSKTAGPATNSTWQLGDDLEVNRLGFGAMRLTGDSIWGWPADRDNALKVLRR